VLLAASGLLAPFGYHQGVFQGEMMAPPLWTVRELNALDRDDFVARLGFLFEGSPWIAAEAWARRPFADRDQLEWTLVEIIETAPEERQVALIRAHPDLVGRAALAGSLTKESTGEQRAAGLDPNRLSPAEVARFAEANAAYKAKFAFPFVICARENKKESILNGFAARLTNSREVEIETAVREIARIGHYRLIDVVA
jgi:2-oxo-4-hydroxy-4-carboxy-5-ureidoimidazoline decarboxylase